MIYELDILAAIVAFVPKGDLLPTALTCKALCEVCVVHKKGKWMTLAAENRTRFVWSTNVMCLNPEKDLCTKAMYEGRLDILIWARELGYNVNKYKDIYTCAALHGQLHILEWARYQCSFPWDERGPSKAANACTAAALSGNVMVLHWLRKNCCPWNKDECLRVAEFFEYSSMVNWIHEN